MKAEQAKKIADQALTTLIEALKQGHSDALRRYLAMMGKFHHYSFRNVCLIAMQKPDATQVAGFGTWKQMGRFVKSGEKGIVIVAPMLVPGKADDNASPANNNAPQNSSQDSDASKPHLRFRGTYVFDISQTDGAALPELGKVAGDPGEHLQRLQDAIRSRGITLDHDNVPEGCDGVSRGSHISVRAGMPPAEEFSVTVHELAHELLHRVDANTDDNSNKKRPSKQVRETQAEAVAFVVCSAVGLDTGNAAKDYIQLYSGDDKMLIASLEEVQCAAGRIIEAITPEQYLVDTEGTDVQAS